MAPQQGACLPAGSEVLLVGKSKKTPLLSRPLLAIDLIGSDTRRAPHSGRAKMTRRPHGVSQPSASGRVQRFQLQLVVESSSTAKLEGI